MRSGWMYHAPSRPPALILNPSCAPAVGHEVISRVTKLKVLLSGMGIQTRPCTESARSQRRRCGAPARSPRGAAEGQGVAACLCHS